MSYDFHVRRKGAPVGRDEWLELVRAEGDEWSLLETLRISNPITGELIEVQSSRGEPWAVWAGHPDPSMRVTFRWNAGQVSISGNSVMETDPTDPVFAKLKAVAKRLHAQVVGDEGEVY
jgi:hypothetical protein